MKINETPMSIILDYDEFGIYSNREDIQNYIESLFIGGVEDEGEIYKMCIERFGEIYTDIINELFSDNDED